MLYVDYEVDSVEDAIARAIQELDVDRDDITTEVLQEGKRGLFGIAKKELTKVRIYYKERNSIDAVIIQVRGIVQRLDDRATLEVRKISDERYDIIISSDSSSHIIGKKGKTLKSIQVLVNSLIRKQKKHCTVIVDIDHYNIKREGQFAKWAESQAKEVLRTKRSIVLKSLNSYERRLIHMEISKYDSVTTESKGEGRIKNIKIRYTGQQRTLNQPFPHPQ